jgi:hypothetical protein
LLGRRLLPSFRKINPRLGACNAFNGEFSLVRFGSATVGIITHAASLESTQVAPLTHHAEYGLVATLVSGISN